MVPCGYSFLGLQKFFEASAPVPPASLSSWRGMVGWCTATFALQEQGASVWLWLHSQGQDSGMDNDASWEGGFLWDRAGWEEADFHLVTGRKLLETCLKGSVWHHV